MVPLDFEPEIPSFHYLLICTWLLWWDTFGLGFMCLLIGFNSVSPTNFHRRAVQGWLVPDLFPAAIPLLQASCTGSKNESNSPKAHIFSAFLLLLLHLTTHRFLWAHGYLFAPGFQLQEKLSLIVGKNKKRGLNNNNNKICKCNKQCIHSPNVHLSFPIGEESGAVTGSWWAALPGPRGCLSLNPSKGWNFTRPFR